MAPVKRVSALSSRVWPRAQAEVEDLGVWGAQGAYHTTGALGVDPVTVATEGVVYIPGLLHHRPVDVQVDVIRLPRVEP